MNNIPAEFERPLITIDILVCTIVDKILKIVLIKRKSEPFQNSWALPGGFVQIDESLEECAKRELHEEAGIKTSYLEQLYTFGDPKRDPRGRVITVAYFALVPGETLNLLAGTDASQADLFPVNHLPHLAFDHKKIVEYGTERLKSKLQYSTIAHGLLPKKFRLSELQETYEIILGHPLDKRNFRKKVMSLNIVEPLKEKEVSGAHRPAGLFQFKTTKLIYFD